MRTFLETMIKPNCSTVKSLYEIFKKRTETRPRPFWKSMFIRSSDAALKQIETGQLRQTHRTSSSIKLRSQRKTSAEGFHQSYSIRMLPIHVAEQQSELTVDIEIEYRNSYYSMNNEQCFYVRITGFFVCYTSG